MEVSPDSGKVDEKFQSTSPRGFLLTQPSVPMSEKP
jgi:hypothetical protein